MRSQKILFTALWSVLHMTEQGNNNHLTSQRKTLPRVNNNGVTMFGESDNFPKLRDMRINDDVYNGNQRRREKRNLIRRFINQFREKRTERDYYDEKPPPPPVYTGLWSVPPKYGTLPIDAFSAGLDTYGQPVFIGRAFIPEEKSVVPGRLGEYDVCVEVSWEGWGRCVGNYKVLVGKGYAWKPGHRNWFPYKLVVAGNQDNLGVGRGKLFVCRYYIRDENWTDQLVIGKVTMDGRCIVGHNGDEIIFHGVYEILTLTQ